MIKKPFTKREFKQRLTNTTGCKIQYTGWCCGTCFFSLSETLTNQDWQSLLLYRGDCKKKDLNNLPQNKEDSLNKIWELIKNN